VAVMAGEAPGSPNGNGKTEVERRALADLAVHPNLSAVDFDETLCDVEPESQAAWFTRAGS